MKKTFRGKNTTLQARPAVERMADKPEDVPWPCIAGPKVPDTNAKLWKTPRLDMNSSLAFLRRELTAMQLQDRAIHKQLLSLYSVIHDLKEALSESREQEEQSEIEAVCYQTETSSAVTKVEVISSCNRESDTTQVLHAKQDSGIMTDEEHDEESDVFVSEPAKLQHTKVRSVSVINLPSYHSSIDIDINNNKRTQSMRRSSTNSSNSNAFQEFNLSIPRSRSHTVSTEGHFHRVTSMPVINENPDQVTKTSKIKGKAFAIYGYANGTENMRTNSTERAIPFKFGPLSRHESMPIISGHSGSDNVHHHRSQTEPVPFQRGRLHSSFSSHLKPPDRPVARSSSQMDLSRIDQQNIKPYRIFRISSQVSLV